MNAAAQEMQDRLIAAITDERGGLRAITRIEFELVGRQIRWTIWEGERRLHTVNDRAEDAAGFLEATREVIAMRAEDLAEETARHG